MPSSAVLRLIDTLVAEGRTVVSSVELRDLLGVSPQAASNLLTRLERDGLVERVRRGVYLVRPLGELGVSSVSGDRLAEAIVVAVGDREHRVCFRTALHHHGLLSRSEQRVQVAVSRRLFVRKLGGWPLESIIEATPTIGVGAEAFDDATVSTVERALLEASEFPRRVGGISVVAEALAMATVRVNRLTELSRVLSFDVGLRRLVSLDGVLELGKLSKVRLSPRNGRPLSLDPTDSRADGPLDLIRGVRWPGPIGELTEVVFR